MRLLRTLFPSWKFFDQFHGALQLYGRAFNQGESSSSWVLCLTPPPRNWAAIFLNPKGNLYHLSNSTLERLIQESLDTPLEKIDSLVSYQLVRQMALEGLRSQFDSFQEFQFKITLMQANQDSEEILISQIDEV